MKNVSHLTLVLTALCALLWATSGVFAEGVSCTDCHNDTSLITAKDFAWSKTAHGLGEAAEYAGGRSSCTGCHSGASFSAMVAAGLKPDEVETVTAVTPQDCRACHQIHTTYTDADWALETTAPVSLIAFEDVTFDGGKGNLCATCHQARRTIAAPDADGMIAVTSSHWGPHHGPQSGMLLGIGGAGDVKGKPSKHSEYIADTCVSCHLGANDDHSFEPSVAACQICHTDAEDFDMDGTVTKVDDMLKQLGDLLIAKGLLTEDGAPVVGTYPAAQAQALWNYIFIHNEDGSHGVHNPDYTEDLLKASLAALQ